VILFFVIQCAESIALQVSFTKIEFPFDMTTSFIDQLAALQLPKNVPALRIDEQKFRSHHIDRSACVSPARRRQFGAVETLDVPSPNAVDHCRWQAGVLAPTGQASAQRR